MPTWFFASDLHGHQDRYLTLFERIADERPTAVLLGGDLLPNVFSDAAPPDFVCDFLVPQLRGLRKALGSAYPDVLLILGNDDGRAVESAFESPPDAGLWHYIHNRRQVVAGRDVLGYACVPPTPFLLKDWERYDVSRYVDPGCVSPEDGHRTVPADASDVRYGTIKDDLAALVGNRDLTNAILLLHAPPYQTRLDRAALDGQSIDHVPLDVHVGSIAIRRLIEQHQPRLTLHGHIHESARLTGDWRERIGRTYCFSAAHDGPELALVRFDPEHLDQAVRTLR
jgi:Icc-related predicted phosphoesterase